MLYKVPLIPQPTGMSCWAASIAMILSWKRNQSILPRTIAANVGGLNYMPQFQTQGLGPNDRYILGVNGFELEAPQCYTLESVNSLMTAHGPLWVASADPAPHIRVVTGIAGNMLSVNDPLPVGVGAQYKRPFMTFFGKMETLGSRELNQPSPVYVAYLK
jgi:hypothetical protein